MAGIRDLPAPIRKTLRVGLSSHRPRGRFLDSFYLDGHLTLALADGSFIYVTEKYKIVSGAKS